MDATAYYSSPIGLIKMVAVGGQLVSLRFAEVLEDDAQNEGCFQTFLGQLYQYFKGADSTFPLPLHLTGTPFQQQVWRLLMQIPHGRTRSYEEMAIAMGDRKKIRAVANAISRNPLPIVIPCHRVVGKNGDLTGYLGGLWRKQYLLDLEQVRTQPPLIPLVTTSGGHH
jgi:methylated-DNA-[protein]-cysteine S-methyltransferase